VPLYISGSRQETSWNTTPSIVQPQYSHTIPSHQKPLQRPSNLSHRTLRHHQSCRPSKIKLRTTLRTSIRRLVVLYYAPTTPRAVLNCIFMIELLLNICVALQVSYFEQFGEADFGSQSICFPGPYRNVFLLHLLQHWRSTPYQHRRICDPRILLFGGFVQCWKE